MFRRKARASSAKLWLRYLRPTLEQLEDRCLLASGVTEFTAGITAGALPTGIVNAPDGNFWFTEFGASRIGRITPIGGVTEFVLPAGRGPVNIAVGPDNNLYFTENTGDRIGRINALAGSDAAIQASITEFSVPGAGSAPNGITSGPDGALWFTETGSDEIGRLTTAGVITNEFAVPGAGSAPAGITAGSDGALWFTEAGSGEIGRITTAGVISEFTVPVNGGGVSDPESITSGPGGDLFFTDFGRDQVGRITTAGAITQFTLPLGSGPQGIVASTGDNLYFTEAGTARIGRLPASEIQNGSPLSGSPPLVEFSTGITPGATPVGITAATNGDLWFTENNNNAIGRLAAPAPLNQITVAATGSTVQVYDNKLQLLQQITPFPGFGGSVRVAVGDVNGDSVADVIVGVAGGAGPHVKVFDGGNGSLLASFFAFGVTYKGGISLASADVNNDGKFDIIVGAGAGSSHVKVIDATKLGQVQADGQIADSALYASFFAFASNFPDGVSLAAGDMNGDNRADLIVGAGPGAGPHVKIIDATKLGQVNGGGQIDDSALLASFFAFGPTFHGGVFVAVGDVNGDSVRDIVVGAGAGAGPHVKVIDGKKLGQGQGDGQIADSALLASFFAFGPSFPSGVRVAADFINADGLADIIVGAGPGAGPHVKVIDAGRLGQVLPSGQIADSALLASFFSSDPAFAGGVFVAADRLDGPTFGPPGTTVSNLRHNINDVFAFQSPANANNSVMILDVSPFSTATTPNTFNQNGAYELRVANRDLVNTTDDLDFRVTFGAPDVNGVQDVTLRSLPAARFPGTGGILSQGKTGQNLAVRGVAGGMFRAAEQDDPFLEDRAGLNLLLNHSTAVAAIVAGDYPRGTSPNGFGPGSTPNFDAGNFFGPNVNTLAITLEIPSARLLGTIGNVIGVWGRTELNGVQVDREGRPEINTLLIPPVPRGANFPIGQGGQNTQERRNAFNAGQPKDDAANFKADMVSALTAFWPAGRPGGNPSAAQAGVVADLLLPDILVFDVTSNTGFFGNTSTVNGKTYLGNGRKLSDDVISTYLALLTDDDLPASLGGGPNPPAIVTQNVRDDNGQNLTDGSLEPPPPQGNGAAGTGTVRAIAFPYIGARRANPTGLPGGNPPP